MQLEMPRQVFFIDFGPLTAEEAVSNTASNPKSFRDFAASGSKTKDTSATESTSELCPLGSSWLVRYSFKASYARYVLGKKGFSVNTVSIEVTKVLSHEKSRSDWDW